MVDKEGQWINTIKEGKEIITFKDRNTNIIKFMDNGIETETEIAGKKRQQVSFKVLDTLDKDKDKDFNIVSKRLLNALKEIYPLKDKTIRIEAIGSGFQRHFTAEVIEQKTPKIQKK